MSLNRRVFRKVGRKRRKGESPQHVLRYCHSTLSSGAVKAAETLSACRVQDKPRTPVLSSFFRFVLLFLFHPDPFLPVTPSSIARYTSLLFATKEERAEAKEWKQRGERKTWDGGNTGSWRKKGSVIGKKLSSLLFYFLRQSRRCDGERLFFRRRCKCDEVLEICQKLESV